MVINLILEATNLWASLHENLSAGTATRQGSNQHAQLQRIASILSFLHVASLSSIFKVNNKGTDQTTWMCQAGLCLCSLRTTARFSRDKSHMVTDVHSNIA